MGQKYEILANFFFANFFRVFERISFVFEVLVKLHQITAKKPKKKKHVEI